MVWITAWPYFLYFLLATSKHFLLLLDSSCFSCLLKCVPFLLDCFLWECVSSIFTALDSILSSWTNICTSKQDSSCFFFFILSALLYITFLFPSGGRWSNFSFSFIKPNSGLVVQDISRLPSLPAM